MKNYSLYFDFVDMLEGSVLSAVMYEGKRSARALMSSQTAKGVDSTNAILKSTDALVYSLNELYKHIKDNSEEYEGSEICLYTQQVIVINWIIKGCSNLEYQEKVESATDIMRFLAEEYGVEFSIDKVDKTKNLAKIKAEEFKARQGQKVKLSFGSKSEKVKLNFNANDMSSKLKKTDVETEIKENNVIQIESFKIS